MAQKGRKRKNRKWGILLLILVIILAIRLILPYAFLHYANKSLKKLNGYYGYIEDINLAFIRGAYVINGITVDKVDSATNQKVPFFFTQKIDLSVEWASLFKGKVVGEVHFFEPVLRFTRQKADPEDVAKDTSDFREVFNDMMPLRVNLFEIINGGVHYVDSTGKSPVNIYMGNVNLIAHNFSSVEDTSKLPARIDASASIHGGHLTFRMRLDPLASDPTFDMNAELKDTNLQELNDFLNAYAKVDVSKGTFGLYTEVAAENGKFIGYVKPVIKDLEILGSEDKNDNFFRKAWEAIVGAAAKILENDKKEQVATKVPLEGNLKDISVGTFYAVVGLLRNAFVLAIYPSIDNAINLQDVDQVGEKEDKKGIIEKLFDGEKKDEKKKDEKKDKEKDKKN